MTRWPCRATARTSLFVGLPAALLVGSLLAGCSDGSSGQHPAAGAAVQRVPGGRDGLDMLRQRRLRAIRRQKHVRAAAALRAEMRGEYASRSVHHADVDGDGRSDTITLRWTHLSNPRNGQGEVRVSVHLAAGSTASVREPVLGWISHSNDEAALPWVGAANLDGRPGTELAIGTDQGASYDFFNVFTWQSDRLVKLPPPPNTAEWNDGGSVGTGSSNYACNGWGLTVINSLPPRQRTSPRAESQYRVSRSTYRWRGSSWLLLGRSTTVGREYYPTGDICPGLPQL